MKTWAELETQLRSADEALSQRSRERLGCYHEQFEETLAKLHGVMADAFATAQQEGWQERKLGLASLYTFCLGRLTNSYRRLLEGYLSDAVILSRAAFEGLWLVIDLDIDATGIPPETEARIDRWLRGEQFVSTGDTIKRRGEHNQRLKERWGALSDLSHPGKFGAVMLAFDTSEPGKPPQFRFGLFGIERPAVADLILHINWEQALALIHYAPLAFVSAIDKPAQLSEWLESMRSRMQEFEHNQVLPTWRRLFASEQEVEGGSTGRRECS